MKGGAESFSGAVTTTSVPPSAPAHRRPGWWATPEFRRSLPLFLAAAIFFTAGIVLRFGFPADANYGPGAFAFWALLLALGFTCTIGGVISWTLGGGEAATPATETAVTPPTPTYLPINFLEPPLRPPTPEPARVGRPRAEFGRPVPEVRPAAAAEDFYEGPTDSERFEGPSYVLPIEITPVVEPALADESLPIAEPIDAVLADLERIERDLAPRARSVEPSSA
jgi:hypothetical protein